MFKLDSFVGQLLCNEALSCRVMVQLPWSSAYVPLSDWAATSCWFDYRHFTMGEWTGSIVYFTHLPVAYRRPGFRI